MNNINITMDVGDSKCYQFFGKPDESVNLIINDAITLNIVNKQGNGYVDGISINYESYISPYTWQSMNIAWQDSTETWTPTEGISYFMDFFGDENECNAYEEKKLELADSTMYYVFNISYIPLKECPSALCINFISADIYSNWVLEDNTNYTSESEDNMIMEL